MNPSRLSTICEAPQGHSSPGPQRIRASQSRSEQPLRIISFLTRASTPRPDRASAIVVKPCKGERKCNTGKTVFKDGDAIDNTYN